MHLMALLKLDPPALAGHDLRAIRAMFLKFDSAAQIYCQIAVELEEAAQSGQGIHREFVKQLLLKHKVFCRALPSKIDLIVKFVAEKR
jgi:hypothetical protein